MSATLNSSSSLGNGEFTLAHHPHVNRKNVHYRNKSGHITIEGTVNSYFEKQMAQEALRNLDGVESIENQLMVDHETGALI